MEIWNDPIVEEVRAARAAYAEEMHHDLTAICADLRRRQAEHAKRVVGFQPKPPPDAQHAA
ncbi:MAG: hypothetical protein EXR27_21210 [Betaproteobacteria bacterium]|nr:hypothetical protein [Betaproteobacteria bacterium]